MSEHDDDRCEQCGGTLMYVADDRRTEPGTIGLRATFCPECDRDLLATLSPEYFCGTCLDGTVTNDTCDECGERHCPDCDPCEDLES